MAASGLRRLSLSVDDFRNVYDSNRVVNYPEPYRSLLPLLFKSVTEVDDILSKNENSFNAHYYDIDFVAITLEKTTLFMISNLNKPGGVKTYDPNYDNFYVLIAQAISILKSISVDVRVSSDNAFENSKNRVLLKNIETKHSASLEQKFSVFEADFKNRYEKPLKNVELAVQEETFKKLAEDNQKDAEKWLINTYVTAGIVLFLLVFFWCLPLITEETVRDIRYLNIGDSVLLFSKFYIVKNLVARVLITSLSLYALAFCVKNYNSSKHNYTINMHRSNSIHGARWLIDKAFSKEAGDQIMLHSANSIFSHQPTGYSSKDPENLNESTMKIIEKVTDKVAK